MWLHKSALCLLVIVGLAMAQSPDGNKRLRFRRPRPQVTDIDNPEGVEAGPPIPLRRVPAAKAIPQQSNNPAALLATAAQTEEDQADADLRQAVQTGQSLQNTDALQSLLATAAQDSQNQQEVVELPEPEQQVEEEQPEPVAVTAAPAARPAAPRRQPPTVPRRAPGETRPRAESADAAAGSGEEEKGQRIPNRPREEPVKTTDNYSHSNPDGSFTFGYVAEDGSFREETRGVDCITRGKYGYIDPDGRKREFTYVSGLPCNTGEEGAEQTVNADGETNSIQDPIDPSERFRTAAAVQLADSEIPDSARPRPQRPQVAEPAANPDQARIRARPRPQNARPATASPALDNLFNVAGGEQAVAVEGPTRRPIATTARPAAAVAVNNNFDFDSEVDSFTLKQKPALTFDEQVKSVAAAEAPKPVGPNFSSELVFDPASGTFKTDLRQSVAGQNDIRITQANQPQGAAQPQAFSPTPLPTTLAPRPTATPSAAPFTAFASTQRPTVAATPTAAGSFAPLNFPEPVVNVASPSTPAPTASPSTPASPVPSPTTPIPATASTAQQPAGSFFFQPFATVGTPRPVAPGQPATPTAAPFTITAAPATATPSPAPVSASPTPAAAFASQQPQQFAFAQPQQPAGVTAFSPQPTPQPQAGPTPSVQFGFQPIQQTPQPQVQAAQPAAVGQSLNGRPFTAFSAGLPPQLNGVPQQQFLQQPQQFRPQQPQQFVGQQPQQFAAQQPQQFAGQQAQFFGGRPVGAPQQFGVPQQQPQQFGAAPGGARFAPLGRPQAQPAPGAASPFTVFNPNNFVRQS